MSATILEKLQNAQINIETSTSFTTAIAKKQLNNAIILLEKGYGVDEEIKPFLEKYGDVEKVPENEKDNKQE